MPDGITEAQVIAAAEALRSAGMKVSNRTVRDKLGDTGSYDTIAPHLRKWRAQEANPAAPRTPIPEQLTSRLLSVSRELWTAALEHGDLQVNALRVHLEVVQREVEGERDEALHLADELHVDLTRLSEELAEQVAHGTALAAELDQARAAAVSAQQAEHLVAARAGELARHVAGLSAELERQHTQAEGERQAREHERESIMRRHTAELERHRLTADKERQTWERERETTAQQHQANLNLRDEEAARRSEVAAQLVRQQDAELTEVRAERQALRDELNALREQAHLERVRSDDERRVRDVELALALEKAQAAETQVAVLSTELESSRNQAALLREVLTRHSPQPLEPEMPA